jgi:hypothetical protein
MFPRIILVVMCLGSVGPFIFADEPPKYKPIDRKTIEAYERLGAKHGYFTVGYGWLRFSKAMEATIDGLPAFRFHVDYMQPADYMQPDSLQIDARLANLPSVDVPFGLVLPGPATDASLKHLHVHKNLTALSLRETQVTDAGLKDLKPFKNLEILDLVTRK